MDELKKGKLVRATDAETKELRDGVIWKFPNRPWDNYDLVGRKTNGGLEPFRGDPVGITPIPEDLQDYDQRKLVREVNEAANSQK